MGLDRYRWITKQTKIEHLLGNNQLESRIVITIAVKDKETGLVVPHPITHFIREKYEFKGKSLSSQLNPARQIVKFLNFINEQIILKNRDFLQLQEKGIRGLTLIHGSLYITSCTEKKCQYGYVRGHIERYLIHFYDYLLKMKLLDEEIELDTYITRSGDEAIISPFLDPTLDTQYPPTDGPIKQKLKDFGDDPKKRNKLVYEFLEEARRVSPEIAFGIGLQIFGGLRRGEVVNLTVGSVSTDFLRGSNFVAVLDNQHRLFTHLKDTTKEQVKRPRLQPVLPSDYLKELYDAHMKLNEKVKKKNPHAFFVDRKGNTISGGTYERNFTQVKKAYLDRLNGSSGRYSDWRMLDSAIWGTHIGRGIFTNYLYGRGLDDRQMAILRGDKNTESAKSYIDYRNAISNFQDAMELFSTNEILDAEKDLAKKWDWEVFSKR
ncbi:site-specific integrase [Lysinibacillus fusiformis]|uniref:site-specific integrase n=1 Tax=Lysinibacillus fusiformis TaxID=28031 RepID=UPI00124548FA|nr:site-specific integrase [Lysinibacillus fusiformis]KAB0443973.1 hypothetical protein CH314_10245 [Lysinibacillus fusiformis]